MGIASNAIILLYNKEQKNVGYPLWDIPDQPQEVTQPPLKVDGGNSSSTVNAHGGVYLVDPMQQVLVCDEVDCGAAVE